MVPVMGVVSWLEGAASTLPTWANSRVTTSIKIEIDFVPNMMDLLFYMGRSTF
jgi:hypothetical protein